MFLVLFFVGDRFGGFLLQQLMDQSALPLSKLYAGKGRANLVVLGNSRAYRHLLAADMAEGFGMSSASLAQPGAGMREQLALLRDHIDRYGAPRLVIVEAGALITDSDSLTNLRPYLLQSPRLAELVRADFPNLYYAGQLSHLYNFNSSVFLNGLHKIVAPVGDLRLSGALSAERAAAFDSATVAADPAFRIVQRQWRALRDLVGEMNGLGVELRVIATPLLPAYGRHQGYDAWRDNLAAMIAPAPLWDYGLDHGLPASRFADANHMNAEGVAAFLCLLRQDGFFELGATPPVEPAATARCVSP